MATKISRRVYADMFGRMLPVISGCLFAASFTFPLGSALRSEGEWRWRLFDNDGRLMLAVADTDLGGDAGSLFFQCKRASGIVEIIADMDQEVRRVVADLILNNGSPYVELAPGTPSGAILQ